MQKLAARPSKQPTLISTTNSRSFKIHAIALTNSFSTFNTTATTFVANANASVPDMTPQGRIPSLAAEDGESPLMP